MTTTLPRIMLILACATPIAAPTQPAADGGSRVFRCGNGQYSSTPCPGGVAIDADDPRSPQQQRDARDAAAREARLAQQLAAERRERERAAAGQRAVAIGALPAASHPQGSAKPAHRIRKKPKVKRSAAAAPAAALPASR